MNNSTYKKFQYTSFLTMLRPECNYYCLQLAFKIQIDLNYLAISSRINNYSFVVAYQVYNQL